MSRKPRHVLEEARTAPRVIALTFALGGLGGLMFQHAGVPLGMMMGSLLAVAAFTLAGGRIFGRSPAVPQQWRFALIPFVGVAIGAGFTPELFGGAAQWWPSLLAMLLYVPLMHFLSYQLFRRLGGIDRPTALFSAMPGGYIEALEMGEAARADMRMLIMLQFLRLTICILAVPIVVGLLTGQVVGSGSDVPRPGKGVPIAMTDLFWLVLAGAGGWAVAHRLRVPAAVLTGPLLGSGLVHIAGLTAATPPDVTILLAQWVVGTSLGTRFAGLEGAQARLGFRLSLLNALLAFAVALALALSLATLIDEPALAIFLAFAPGGVSEMALVALSLQLGAVYVALHHLLRIVLAVFLAGTVTRRVLRKQGP